MLRWVIWLLVLANAGYFAWSQGHLAPVGYAPPQVGEPQRLDAQIKPEAQRLLNAPRGSAAESPAPAPRPTEAVTTAPVPPQPADVNPAGELSEPTSSATEELERSCWQAGAFTEAQAEVLRRALSLAGIPEDRWSFAQSRSSGRWIVYMGRYDDQDQLERKKVELRELGVAFREVSATGLRPGLALGTFSSEVAAQKALQDAARAGVRTAQVAQERAESLDFTLRLPAITSDQRQALAGLGTSLAGRTLQPCN